MNTKKKDINLKVIPTVYKGIKFRSRTEARWAVVFDALDADWEYEPEGLDLDDVWYLPDFVIHNFWQCQKIGAKLPGFADYAQENMYIEVKGSNEITREDYIKLSKMFCSRIPLLVVGSVPSGNDWESIYKNAKCKLSQSWAKVREENSKDTNIKAHWYRIDDHLPTWNSKLNGIWECCGRNGIPLKDRLITIAAYQSGLSAKFEHGEIPQILTTEEVYDGPLKNSYER